MLNRDEIAKVLNDCVGTENLSLKEVLEELYINQRLSGEKIAKLTWGLVCPTSIYSFLKAYGIRKGRKPNV